MNKTINPELVLAGARMAFPCQRWFERDGIICNSERQAMISFNPIGVFGDAWALERALKCDGWGFELQYLVLGPYDERSDPEFRAWRRGLAKPIADKSDTLLLLKCLSAQTGIPMYLEDKQ